MAVSRSCHRSLQPHLEANVQGGVGKTSPALDVDPSELLAITRADSDIFTHVELGSRPLFGQSRDSIGTSWADQP